MKQTPLVKQILESAFFSKARRQAEEYLRNPGKLTQLLKDAGAKSAKVTDLPTEGLTFTGQVATLIRMIRAFARGEYRDISWRSIGLTIATLVYFVSPLDFIPDLLPVVGLTDDIALVIWLFRSLREDIERFRLWENSVSDQAIIEVQ